MRFTIGAILVVAAGLAVAVARSGHAGAGDMIILGVAIGSVCIFGALPVLLANRRKAAEPPDRVTVRPGKRADDR